MGHLFLPYFWHLPVLRLPRILGKAFQKRTKTQERILHQRSQTRKVHIAVAVTITNHQRRFQLPESARVIILQKRKHLPTYQYQSYGYQPQYNYGSTYKPGYGGSTYNSAYANSYMRSAKDSKTSR